MMNTNRYCGRMVMVKIWIWMSLFTSLSSSLYADYATIDGIEWKYTPFYRNGVLCARIGYGTSSSVAIRQDTRGAITVPTRIYSARVVEISSWSFQYCTNITSVTVPSSVTKIGEWAFYGCRSLKSVTLPDGLSSIGENLFKGCVSLETLKLPDGLNSVPRMTCDGCRSLKSIHIPSKATVIGEFAFENCVSLLNVELPDGVTQIGRDAFYGCDSLSSLNIPATVSRISEDAFKGCSRLGDGIVVVDDCVLAVNGKCPEHVSLPSRIRLLADSAFKNCITLKSIIVPDGITKLSGFVFDGCTNLVSVTIPTSVITIGGYAFYRCTALPEVKIPKNVSSVGAYAFCGCSSLRSIVIPMGVAKVCDSTFASCRSLSSVAIPESVLEIETTAFTGCLDLKSVTIPSSITSISNIFPDAHTHITHVGISDGAVEIGTNILKPYTVFRECPALSSVTIPSSVTNVGYGVFSGCTGIRDITVPGWRCGIDCHEVTNIVISSGTMEIKEDAFSFCMNISTLSIPEGVKSIGACAFSYCTELKTISIPSTVTSIGEGTFSHCDALKSILLPSNKCYLVDEGLLMNASGTRVLRCLSDKTGECMIPSSVTDIDPGAFSSCHGLTSVIIPSGIKTIGEEVFYYCKGLTSITIPNGIETIGDEAFDLCWNLASVYIPSSVVSIGEEAFDYCDLKTVYVDDGDDDRVRDLYEWGDDVEIKTQKPNLAFTKEIAATAKWPLAVFLGNSSTSATMRTTFNVGDDIYLYACFINNGSANTGSGFKIHHELLDASSNVCASAYTDVVAMEPNGSRWFYGSQISILQNLPAGECTYRCTLDYKSAVSESDETDNMATYAFEVIDSQPKVSFGLPRGWTWFSVNVTPDDASFATVFKGVAFADGDVIKSSDGSATYYDGKWYPSPATFGLVPGRAYAVKKSTAGTATVTVAGEVTATSLAVEKGWNWIGPTASATVALKNLKHSAGFMDEDVINSSTGSATYYGGEWFGSLESLTPGVGYKAKFGKAGTLQW